MIIFSPGPANISEKVRKALTLPDISHRGEEFASILDECRKNLLKICGAEKRYKSVVFTGSGTAAIEASITAIKGITDQLFVISNGHYGERASEIGRYAGLKVKEVKFPSTALPDLKTIKKELERYDGRFVYVVHHETTTGLLNPLREIAALCKRYGKTLLVDGVSSIAGEELDLQGWEIGLVIGSANKCIRGIPGLSFVILRKSLLKDLSRSKRCGYYLNLVKHHEAEEAGQTPFTPAVQAFYGLREALRELLKEGVDNRIQKYKETSAFLRKRLRAAGYKPLIDDSISSNTMTSVILPPGADYETLYGICKDKGFVIYNAIGNLRGKTFRVGTVGIITKRDITGFLEVLKDFRKRAR